MASAGAICGFDTAGDASLVSDGATPTYNAGGWVDVSGATGGDWSGIEINHTYGDMSAMTHITMDLIGDWSSAASNGMDIAIFNTGWAASRYQAEALILGDYADWTTVTLELVEADWDVWGGTWADMIADVQGFSLYTFPTTGAQVDNLGFIPEPLSLTLLAVGGAVVLRRRRR